MKRWMMLAALAASSMSCVEGRGDAAVRFLDARALSGSGGACTLGTSQLASGLLDIAAGNSYLLGLRVETTTAVPRNVIGGNNLGGSGLNDFLFEEVILTYESQPSLPLPAEERIPVYGVFRPGTPGESGSFAILYALGPKALEVLAGSVSDEPVTVLTTLKVAGRYSSGQKSETNEVTYPITVVNSGYNPDDNSCPAPKVPTTSGWACDNVGQDNVVCRTPTASPSP